MSTFKSPLSKLLLALASYLCSLDGSFDFKDIGAMEVYIAMRFPLASLGVALVPITRLTLRKLGSSASTALPDNVLVPSKMGWSRNSSTVHSSS
jgi:dolichyl-phosphate-mannose--protein O-mannosyl transferase